MKKVKKLKKKSPQQIIRELKNQIETSVKSQLCEIKKKEEAENFIDSLKNLFSSRGGYHLTTGYLTNRELCEKIIELQNYKKENEGATRATTFQILEENKRLLYMLRMLMRDENLKTPINESDPLNQRPPITFDNPNFN